MRSRRRWRRSLVRLGAAVRVAYLVGRYPSVTHTFILRELRALDRLGLDVRRFSIWQTAEHALLTPIDREEWGKTEALLAATPGRALRAHLRALALAPRAYLTTLERALALSAAGLRRRAVAVSWFIEAMLLWDACRRGGVRHIHVHLDGTAPMVALLTVEFANAAADGAWSWSQTVHGSKEFYDVYRERFDVKAASAKFIICVSDYTRSQVMAFAPEELWPKLVVVRCGVDPDELTPSRSAPERRWADPHGRTDRRNEGHRGAAPGAPAAGRTRLSPDADRRRRRPQQGQGHRDGAPARCRGSGAMGGGGRSGPDPRLLCRLRRVLPPQFRRGGPDRPHGGDGDGGSGGGERDHWNRRTRRGRREWVSRAAGTGRRVDRSTRKAAGGPSFAAVDGTRRARPGASRLRPEGQRPPAGSDPRRRSGLRDAEGPPPEGAQSSARAPAGPAPIAL